MNVVRSTRLSSLLKLVVIAVLETFFCCKVVVDVWEVVLAMVLPSMVDGIMAGVLACCVLG